MSARCRRGAGDLPRGWEYTHELLEGLEWLTDLELDVHLIEIFEICSEGREVEGIVPLPRGRLVTYTLD